MTATGFPLLTLAMLAVPFVWLPSTNSLRIKYVLLTIAWLTYSFTLSQLGFLDSASLPPRVPLFVIFPTIVLSLWLTSTQLLRKKMLEASVAFPILIQAFRILVELLIHQAYLEGRFPKIVTFEGINYDILVGIMALPIGYLAYKEMLSHKALQAWNWLSLAVLSVTGFSFVRAFLSTGTEIGFSRVQLTDFVHYPYLLLPAVLLPFAIFYHIFSIKQLQLKTHGRAGVGEF